MQTQVYDSPGEIIDPDVKRILVKFSGAMDHRVNRPTWSILIDCKLSFHCIMW